ncbi:uncharacterized protein LOC111892701 [Lactuca sativa]|uniref:Uncharacterized protein n=1 Tax=Lactuca sativa TaxID=4236 RepID=A0A9R1UVB7_LACSA|nr:uncharacterized protein LOC111892701 [Lactuca sativa]KAJ0194707.1 hypothetical protein LSAT_V11C700350950 [Lactuca sativa]
MGRATTRIPMSHRVLSPNHNYNTGDNPHDQPTMQLSGSIFGFLEEEATILSSPENDTYSDNIQHEIEDDNETENPEDIEDKIKFWDTQHKNLHSTLFRTTMFESKIRNIAKEVLLEVEMAENECSCSRPVPRGCRSCRMREICSRLQNSGYDSAICKSKWKSSLDIPSGEHTFVDVIDNSNHKKGEVRVIIELELRGQFEMKKGSEEYNGLVSKLPDIFVGKIDRLQTVIKLLSNAAKKCMKEKKMHLGPWRKQRYMQAKWLKVIERITPITLTLIKPLEVDHSYSTRSPYKAKSSMLTMDLLDNLSNMSYVYVHTVEVL